jgi:hypothetical protein
MHSACAAHGHAARPVFMALARPASVAHGHAGVAQLGLGWHGVRGPARPVSAARGVVQVRVTRTAVQ